MLIFEALNLKSNFGIRLENILKSVLLIVNPQYFDNLLFDASCRYE